MEKEMGLPSSLTILSPSKMERDPIEENLGAMNRFQIVRKTFKFSLQCFIIYLLDHLFPPWFLILDHYTRRFFSLLSTFSLALNTKWLTLALVVSNVVLIVILVLILMNSDCPTCLVTGGIPQGLVEGVSCESENMHVFEAVGSSLESSSMVSVNVEVEIGLISDDKGDNKDDDDDNRYDGEEEGEDDHYDEEEEGQEMVVEDDLKRKCDEFIEKMQRRWRIENMLLHT